MADQPTTLADFLLARIAEDEVKVAYMASEAERVKTAPIFRNHPADWLAGVDIFVSPTRWRAECEAKRRIVELHRSRFAGTRYGHLPAECTICESEDTGGDQDHWPCDTLRLLALPLSVHPDYRDEWRP